MFFKKNKAILFIHGFVGGNYDYENLPNELELYKNFDVFTFTLPGHEKTIVSNVKYTDWIKESEKQIQFLINNNYKEIYLIGHSMGGIIATYLASTYHEVKKLVLVSPAFRYFYFKDGKVNIKDFNETMKNLPSIFKSLGKDTVTERIVKTPISTMLEFTKLVETYDNTIENITCPTLIIHGNDDKIAPKESTDFAFEKIKSNSCKLININKVNHDCFTGERNDEVKDLIKDFLIKKEKKEKITLDI